jgi:hypothetical protein
MPGRTYRFAVKLKTTWQCIAVQATSVVGLVPGVACMSGFKTEFINLNQIPAQRVLALTTCNDSSGAACRLAILNASAHFVHQLET